MAASNMETKIENLKVTPYTNDELGKIAYVITSKFQRLTMLVTTGYLGTEEEFSIGDDDPYMAVPYNELPQEKLQFICETALYRNLQILNNYVNDIQLNKQQAIHLYEGFGYMTGTGDFCVEGVFPLVQYLKLEFNDRSNEYFSQETFNEIRFKNFLIKFLTKFSLDEKGFENREAYGLYELLGLSFKGYNFKQLALMLGLETERTARGLASTNTPEPKRIKTFKAADGSNRTFIEHSVFAEYVAEYQKTRTVHEGEGVKKAFITLTGGNIRNSHLYLTKVMDMFPERNIGGANKSSLAAENLVLEVAANKRFETDIDGKKKIFRSRAALKAFYETYDVSEGDKVVISTDGQGTYTLRPEQSV